MLISYRGCGNKAENIMSQGGGVAGCDLTWDRGGGVGGCDLTWDRGGWGWEDVTSPGTEGGGMTSPGTEGGGRM